MWPNIQVFVPEPRNFFFVEALKWQFFVKISRMKLVIPLELGTFSMELFIRFSNGFSHSHDWNLRGKPQCAHDTVLRAESTSQLQSLVWKFARICVERTWKRTLNKTVACLPRWKLKLKVIWYSKWACFVFRLVFSVDIEDHYPLVDV